MQHEERFAFRRKTLREFCHSREIIRRRARSKINNERVCLLVGESLQRTIHRLQIADSQPTEP